MTTPTRPHSLLQSLLHDYLFWLLLLVLIGLSLTSPANIVRYPALVDWPTMATLTGLLILTKGVELSGFLHRLGAHLTARMRTERALALLLVGVTAVLAAGEIIEFVSLGSGAYTESGRRDLAPRERVAIKLALSLYR